MSSSLKAINSPLVLEPAAPGGALAQAHCGKRRLDHVGGAQVLPVLRREVEEADEALPVGTERIHRLGIFGLIFRFEAHSGGLAVRPPLAAMALDVIVGLGPE